MRRGTSVRAWAMTDATLAAEDEENWGWWLGAWDPSRPSIPSIESIPTPAPRHSPDVLDPSHPV